MKPSAALASLGSVAMYPVSSLSSLMADVPASSPSSINPDGTSMVTLSIGGRNCFCSNSDGPDFDFGSLSIATTPTPSRFVFFGRVYHQQSDCACNACAVTTILSADSHSLCLPEGSSYVTLLSLIHFDAPGGYIYISVFVNLHAHRRLTMGSMFSTFASEGEYFDILLAIVGMRVESMVR